MKIDRLIGILSILLQKDKVTAAELAEKFEVSRRTIIRDIEDINMAGIPIVTSQGNGGGISIMEGFRIDRTLLSSDEMKAIMTGLNSLDSISESNRYKQLMNKLSADSDHIVNADNNIIIDLSMWDKSAVSEKIELIKSAMEKRERIAFTYLAPSGESERTLEPYHLIFQWSSWYVWGYCCSRNDYRMFKLTRISGLRNTGEKCQPRTVPLYTCDKLRHTDGGITAEVLFDKSVKWRLADEFGSEMLRENPDGSISMTFTWSDVQSFYKYILTYGDKAEIISPEEYRLEFSLLLKKISDNYNDI